MDNPISLETLLKNDGALCPVCGKRHYAGIEDIFIEAGALNRLPELVKKYNGSRVFLLADTNTWAAAGEKIAWILTGAGIPCSKYVFSRSGLEPDERTVGEAVMNYDRDCDLIVGVGSGVINDTGKILARTAGHPYIIAATAPSMDGYASSTSSVIQGGLKTSIPSMSATAILGDLDILCAAPEKMLAAGVGDMLAKTISLCEWRVAHLLLGEYYCPYIASLVRNSLHEVVDSAEALMRREPEAVATVMKGMVLAGIAASYAGITRPVSGVEHYFSHIWDMRGLELGTPMELHGIQCGTATLHSLRMYDYIRTLTPNRQKALQYVRSFSYAAWSKKLAAFIPLGSRAMIAGEARERKYDPVKHAARLEVLITRWSKLTAVMYEEMLPIRQVENVLRTVGIPTSAQELGHPNAENRITMEATKDIRDKYVGPRLLWDLGVIDDACIKIFPDHPNPSPNIAAKRS